MTYVGTDAFLGALAATLLGVFCLMRNVRDPRNVCFAGFAFCCAGASIGSLFTFMAPSIEHARRWGDALRWILVWLPSFFLAFCVYFARAEKRLGRPLVWGAFAVSIVLTPLSASRWMVADFFHQGLYIKPIYGPIYWVWGAFFLGSCLTGFVLVLRRARSVDPYLRNRARLFLFALALGLVMGALSFLLVRTVQYPLTSLAILLSMPLMAYSFLADRLWGLRSFSRLLSGYVILGLTTLLPFFAVVVFAVRFFHGDVHPVVMVILLTTLVVLAAVFPDLRRRVSDSFARAMESSGNLRRGELLEGARTLVGLGSVVQVGARLSSLLATHTRASAVLVYVDERKRQGLTLTGTAGDVPDAQESIDETHPGVSWLLERSGPILSYDVREAEKSPAAAEAAKLLEELGAEMAVPVPGGPEVRALLLLGRPADGSIFEPSDLETAALLAQTVQSALGSAASFEQEQVTRQIDLVSRWVASIAHEFRNSLMPARTFLELLPERLDDPGFTQEYREVTLDQLRRSFELIGQLKELHVDHSPRLEPHDLHGIVTGVADSLRPRAQQREIAIHLERSSEPLVCRCDADQLTQALFNLVANAITHAAGQPVVVRCNTENPRQDRGPRRAVVTIHNAASIPEDVLPHVFTPFYSATENRRREDGFGLGLAIAQRLIHGHSGTIAVWSRSGEGTTVVVTLPIAADGAGEDSPSRTLAFNGPDEGGPRRAGPE